MDLHTFIQEELYNNDLMRTTVLIFATYGLVSFIRNVCDEIFKPKPKSEPEPKPVIIFETESDTDSDLLIIDSDSDSYSDPSDKIYVPENMIRKRRRTEQN